MTDIHQAIAAARERLRRSGIPADEASLDARLLAQHVLEWDAARLLAADRNAAPGGFVTRYEALVDRRATREPLAYITGHKEFWNLELDVSRDVLIPRPETELMVEALLERFPDKDAAPLVLDVCTGSGCLAIAVAAERPRARVIASDISEAALGVARRNRSRLGVSASLHILRADVMAGIDGLFDVIMSNPPYVPSGDRSGLQPEVRDFEPPIALFGGVDGLAVIEALVNQSPAHLQPGGVVMFEFGAGQERAVRELISATPGLTMIDVKHDVQHIPRVALAMRM